MPPPCPDFVRPLLLTPAPLRPLQRCKSYPIPVSETPIDWNEIAGSKISLIWDSLGMARDLLVLRLCLGLTKWGVPRIVLDRSK